MTETERDAYARVPAPDAVLEMYTRGAGGPAACAVLTPKIRQKLGELEGGQVLEIRVDDPSALVDVPAWSRLAGHELVATVEDNRTYTFYLRKRMR
jgi:tRNA 2-thiouridine synthesizing protein A